MPSSNRILLIDLDGTLVGQRKPKWIFYTRLVFSIAKRMGQSIGWLRVWPVFKTVRKAIYENTTDKSIFENLKDALESEHGIPAAQTEAFYRSWLTEDYPSFERHFIPIQGAKETLDRLAAEGWCLALATNPVVPLESIRRRAEWAGIDPNRFELITHNANMTRCKPDPDYYLEILAKIENQVLDPEQCVMIGNDAVKDGAAVHAGMRPLIFDFENDPEAWSRVENHL